MAKATKPKTVRVRNKHIRAGEAGDCFRCAVALALQDATGDDHANVYEDWGVPYLEVWSRVVMAPWEVRSFVWAFDSLDRDDGDKPLLPKTLAGTDLAPFSFTLPPGDSDEWKERCSGCEELKQPDELDDEGNCEDCREDA